MLLYVGKCQILEFFADICYTIDSLIRVSFWRLLASSRFFHAKKDTLQRLGLAHIV